MSWELYPDCVCLYSAIEVASCSEGALGYLWRWTVCFAELAMVFLCCCYDRRTGVLALTKSCQFLVVALFAVLLSIVSPAGVLRCLDCCQAVLRRRRLAAVVLLLLGVIPMPDLLVVICHVLPEMLFDCQWLVNFLQWASGRGCRCRFSQVLKPGCHL